MFEFSEASLSNTEGVHPDIIIVFTEAIKVSPIDFGIPGGGGVRSGILQNQMFLDPDTVTNCDGYEKISNHQIPEGEKFGRALDFYAYVNGRASWDGCHLSMVAAVILSTAERLRRRGIISIRLRWGGEFSSVSFDGWDKPHIEIA